MSYAIGALIEPLSVAYNAVMRAKPYLGQPVVVAGAGPIGLAMALCARAAGASPIVVTDLEENRLQQARDMGFAKTLKIELGWDRLTTAENIRKVMGLGCLPQIVFECTGAASSINSACYVSIARISVSMADDRHWRMGERYFKSVAGNPKSRSHS
jgi:L-iditol 2-dehydrogenase